jgi:hypothetical protein
LSGSIQRAFSFSEIASVGHSLSQDPQFKQASLILYAMIYLSLVNLLKIIRYYLQEDKGSEENLVQKKGERADY